MLLRDIHEFIPAGSCVVLEIPGSLEFNPHLIQAIETHPDAYTIRLLFNAAPVDLIFKPMKTNHQRMTSRDLMQIKNLIWDVAQRSATLMAQATAYAPGEVLPFPRASLEERLVRDANPESPSIKKKEED